MMFPPYEKGVIMWVWTKTDVKATAINNTGPHCQQMIEPWLVILRWFASCLVHWQLVPSRAFFSLSAPATSVSWETKRYKDSPFNYRNMVLSRRGLKPKPNSVAVMERVMSVTIQISFHDLKYFIQGNCIVLLMLLVCQHSGFLICKKDKVLPPPFVLNWVFFDSPLFLNQTFGDEF
jgi:hypothetical protein